MPTAEKLAGTTLHPPPSGLVTHPPSQSSASNVNHGEIISATLEMVGAADLAEFRAWLQSVQGTFAEILLCTMGMYFESEVDIRMFFEPGMILACWPIVLAMAEKDGRNYDWSLRSEKTMTSSYCRPDVTISKMYGSTTQGYLNPASLRLLPIRIVEFKGAGAFSAFMGASGQLHQLHLDDSDDWIVITAQIRKYSFENHVKDVLFIDDKWCIYVHFTDVEDLQASVQYLVAPPLGPH